MIKKLRRKFVLSNMALVSIVLVMVFIAVCLFYQQILRAATEEVLRQSIAIRNGQWHKPMLGVPMQKPRMEHIPSFSVMIDAEGNIQDSFGRDNVSISDSALIEAVSQVQNPGYGTLPELSLRYLCMETPDGTRIAFAIPAMNAPVCVTSSSFPLPLACSLYALSLASVFFWHARLCALWKKPGHSSGGLSQMPAMN